MMIGWEWGVPARRCRPSRGRSGWWQRVLPPPKWPDRQPNLSAGAVTGTTLLYSLSSSSHFSFWAYIHTPRYITYHQLSRRYLMYREGHPHQPRVPTLIYSFCARGLAKLKLCFQLKNSQKMKIKYIYIYSV